MSKLLVGMIVLAAWMSSIASANEKNYREAACRETQVRINEVPLPRKNQIGVEWESMRGFWYNESLDESKRFVFEIGGVKTINRKKYFALELIDPISGEVVRKGVVAVKDSYRASGIVTELSSSNQSRKTDDSLIIFRAFKEVEKATGRMTGRSMFVVTIRNLREKVKVCDESHHQLLRPEGDPQ